MARSSNKIARRIDYPGPLGLTLVWTLVGSLAYLRHYMDGHSSVSSARMVFELLTWLTCFYPWIAFGPVVFRIEQHYCVGTHRWSRNVGWLMAAAAPFAFLGAVVTHVLYVALHSLFRQPLSVALPWWDLREFGVQVVLYWTTVAGAYVIRSLIQLHDREQQAAKLALEKSQLETTLHQAELETLRARLNPHFLFNCLQNISVLTREDPDTAGQMLARLGVLLRSALRKDLTPEITLASEIELTRNYASVEQVRFADRLTVLFDISPETEPALVPTFLLQPLVENAIVHGLRELKGHGVISIRSSISSNRLVIVVLDNGTGLSVGDAPRMEFGVGLTSTCKRLEKMYPQQHCFSIRPLPEGGTEVQLVLPLHFEDPQVRVIADEQTTLAGR